MIRGTFYPVTLKVNVNPWNDLNVIVETIPDYFVDMRINRKKWRDISRKSRILFLTKNFVYDIRETISITEASFE